MKIKKLLPGIGSVILTIILWWLQMMENPTSDAFKKHHSSIIIALTTFVWENKVSIGFVVSVITILSIILNNILLYNKQQKKWLRAYMNHVMKEIFIGQYETTRITIFKIQYGYQFILSYCWRAFIKCLFSHLYDKLLYEHFKTIPNPFKQYIYMYSRCSNPHQDGSSTYFPIAKDTNEISGIASHCVYSKQVKIIETESISDFFKPCKTFNKYSKTEQKKINKYEKENILKFEKLRCIHRLSNHLYAEPIYDNKDEIWGVFIVDIDSQQKEVFANKENISNAVRIITLSLNHFK